MARAAKLPAGLTNEDRQWIDWRFDWLCSEFGFDFLRDAQVVGLDDDALLLVSGEKGSRGNPRDDSLGRSKLEQRAEVYFDRVSELMGLDASTVELTFSNSLSNPKNPVRHGTDALYEIALSKAEIQDRNRLIALLAHEIAYIHLVRHDRIDEEAKDDEPLSDLACIFFGLGAFTANATPSRANPIRTGEFTCSLSSDMCGYALASFAYLRGEGTTDWETQIRDDVRQSFNESRDFIEALGTSNIESYSIAEANRYVASSKASIQPIRQPILDQPQQSTEEADEARSEALNYDDTEPRDLPKAREENQRLQELSSRSDEVPESFDRDSYSPQSAASLGTSVPGPSPNSMLLNERQPSNGSVSSHCPECGSRKPEGADYCRDCETEYQDRMERLRTELDSHDENVWGVNFAALVMLALVILAAVAALNFSG
ncbi:MAG: hypothetical protein AB8B50_09025 [Pirellulaceae bacterium]